MALYVSSGSSVRKISHQGNVEKEIGLEGAGALCAGRKSLYCAGAGSVIWRLNRETLLPESVFSGGPSACSMLLSADEQRLYTLMADGDSILLSDAKTGAPQVLACCGSNPQEMVFGDRYLAAAGGESGRVHLFDAETLHEERSMAMPGPVYSVAACGGCIHALCMTQDLSSVLVTCCARRENTCLRLAGIPGRLLRIDNMLLAATQDFLYAISQDGRHIVACIHAPGKAGRLYTQKEKIYLCDQLSECLYAIGQDRRWRLVCRSALHVAAH